MCKIRPTYTAAANTRSCVVCEKPPSIFKLEHWKDFAPILDVLPGRDPSSGNFTNGPFLIDTIGLRPAGMVHSIHLIFSHFSARECLPRYQSPLPSSKNFASALFNSFLHSQKRQFRWKYCNSSPVFELPSDIFPPLFVDVPPLIDPTFPTFTRPFVRPPLLMSYPAIDRGIAPPHHHHRGILRRHILPSHPRDQMFLSKS